jgi:hypothetical protein
MLVKKLKQKKIMGHNIKVYRNNKLKRHLASRKSKIFSELFPLGNMINLWTLTVKILRQVLMVA